MSFYLVDDGTMDTVVECNHCGEQARYNYDGGDVSEDEGPHSYDAFVEWAEEDAEAEHECPRNSR